MIWHSNTIADVLRELQVDTTTGLSESEAANRLEEYGTNRSDDPVDLSFPTALRQQMRSPFIASLLVVAGGTLIWNVYKQTLQEIATDWKQSLIVAGVAIVTAVAGAALRCRALSTTASMHTLSSPEVRTLRDGVEKRLPGYKLVPGDIVLLGIDDIVPADCRLITADHLRCDECELTGASTPTEKHADAVFDDITPLAQRTNMLYSGTIITTGYATAVVVATGARSEMSRRTTRSEHTPSAFDKNSKRLHLIWSVVAVLLSVIACIVGFITQEDSAAVVLTATALSTALVPHGLLNLLTEFTARSIQRTTNSQVRVLRPETCHLLGQVTVVCAEQETLFTEEKVILERAYINATARTISLTEPLPNERGIAPFIRMAVLNSVEGSTIGDAIAAIAARAGIRRQDLLADMPCIGEFHTSPHRHVSIHLADDQTLILVSGDWRSVLPFCTKGDIEKLTKAATDMEAECLQVIAIAYRLTDTAPTLYTSEEVERDLACVGLLGYQTPWQNGITVAEGSNSVVRTILFSNQSATATEAVVANLGFAQNPRVATAEMAASISAEDWIEVVREYDAYCGLSTAQKLQVISALQRQGEVVAVTAGCTVDADLLSAADVGFARGSVATDVVKHEADVLLIEDSYTAMMGCIKNGRRLRLKTIGLYAYFALCALIVFCSGASCLLGWVPMQQQATLLLSLHVILMIVCPNLVWLVENLLKKK